MVCNLGLRRLRLRVTGEPDMSDDLIGDVADGHAAGRPGERDLDTEHLLQIHDQFDRHQQVEADLAERADGADVLLAQMQNLRQLET